MMTAKKPAKAKAVDHLAAAEAAEVELQTIVSAAAAAGGWQPIQAELAAEHARAAVDAREALAKADGTEYVPGDNLTRWL